MTRSDELILNVLDPENGEENDSFDVSEMAYVTIPDYNNYNRHHPKNISYIRPSSYDSLGEYTKTNLREDGIATVERFWKVPDCFHGLLHWLQYKV